MTAIINVIKEMVEEFTLLPASLLLQPEARKIIEESKAYVVPDAKQLKEAYEYLEIEQHTLYLSANPFSPYVYHHGVTYVDIQTLHKDYMELANTKEKITNHELWIESLLEQEKYISIIEVTDKKYALQVFHDLYEKIPQHRKYQAFRELYIRMEYGFDGINPEVLEEVLTLKEDESFKEKLVTDENGYVRIYRGEGTKSRGHDSSYSWTTNPRIAKFFATRFGDEGKIYQGKVHINHVIDYIEDRNEFEILTHPKNVVMIEELKQV